LYKSTIPSPQAGWVTPVRARSIPRANRRSRAFPIRLTRHTEFTYTIEAGFVQIVVPASPTPQAFEATVQRVIAHPRHHAGMGILYDRRAAMTPTPEYLDAVIDITRRYADRLGHCRWAVMLRKNDGEMYATVRNASVTLTASAEPRAFIDLDQALRWLRSGDVAAVPESRDAIVRYEPIDAASGRRGLWTVCHHTEKLHECLEHENAISRGQVEAQARGVRAWILDPDPSPL
jgi:hypothetical protein